MKLFFFVCEYLFFTDAAIFTRFHISLWFLFVSNILQSCNFFPHHSYIDADNTFLLLFNNAKKCSNHHGMSLHFTYFQQSKVENARRVML